MSAHPRDVALGFVAQVNAHSVPGIVGLMTDAHRMVDSLGNVLQGQPALAEGWLQYFAMVPDYRLAIGEVVYGPPVVLLGTASGTYAPDGSPRPANRWSTPVAIRVEIQDGRVAECRIFADNEPIRQRMRE